MNVRKARPLACWLLLSALAVVGCKKADASADCGTSVAGAATNSAGSAGSVTDAGSSSAGAAVGGTTAGVGGNADTGGSAAAAATSGSDGIAGTAGSAPDSSTCAQLSVTTCATGMMCQGLSGQQIAGTAPALCLSAFAVIACGTTVGCAPIPTRATDGSGHDWVFPTTCIPAGWPNTSNLGTRFNPCASAAGGSAGSAGGTGGSGGSGG